MRNNLVSVRKAPVRLAAQKAGFRSGLEARFAALHPGLAYEPKSFEYQVSEVRKYTPDFVSEDGKTWYEIKGMFTSGDRKKMVMLKEQYPDINIIMVFQRPFNRLTKSPKSKTYAQWAEWAGFQWSQFS